MRYAGVGYTYDEVRDVFISPRQFASWVFDDTTCEWVAPTDKPTDAGAYYWNEDSLSWVEVPTQ
jgi:hypothetical protein